MEEKKIFSSINPFKVNMMTETTESKQEQAQLFETEKKAHQINPFLVSSVKTEPSSFGIAANAFNPFTVNKTESFPQVPTNLLADRDPSFISEGFKEPKEESGINPFSFEKNLPTNQDLFLKSGDTKEIKQEAIQINPFSVNKSLPPKIQSTSTTSDNPFLSSRPIKQFGRGGIRSRLGVRKEKEIIGKN